MQLELSGRQTDVPAAARAAVTRRLAKSENVLRTSTQVCLGVIEPEV
jgi:ribosome-associated translation inhibitor RaiA